MAWQTFPTGDEYAPSLGLDGSHEFRSLVANYGDGFKQHSADGVNTHGQKWRITWDNLPIATTGATIKTFLDARGSLEAFLWTPPNDVQMKVRMKGYSEKFDRSQNVVTINTEFEKVFDA